MATEHENNLHDLLASLDNRISHLEDGFESSHNKEGVYERLRKLERKAKVILGVVGAAATAAIAAVIKMLFI